MNIERFTSLIENSLQHVPPEREATIFEQGTGNSEQHLATALVDSVVGRLVGGAGTGSIASTSGRHIAAGGCGVRA